MANGRIVGNQPSARSGTIAWRIACLAGLVAASVLYAWLAGPPSIQLHTPIVAIIAGGLLVGFGTRLGAGWGLVGMAIFTGLDRVSRPAQA